MVSWDVSHSTHSTHSEGFGMGVSTHSQDLPTAIVWCLVAVCIQVATWLNTWLNTLVVGLKIRPDRGNKNHSPRVNMFILCGIPESYRGNSMEHDSQLKVFVYLQGI